MAADSGGFLKRKDALGGDAAAPSSHLPQISRIRVELLSERSAPVHIGNVIEQIVHDRKIALCYLLSNSILGADVGSKLLHHPEMGKIEAIKALRRINLASLRKVRGPARLSKLTGIKVAELYQMSVGRGTNARNISDSRARLIEKKCKLDEGWLDTEHSDIPASAQKQKSTLTPARGEIRYTLTLEEFKSLSDDQQILVDQLLNTIEETVKRAAASAFQPPMKS